MTTAPPPAEQCASRSALNADTLTPPENAGADRPVRRPLPTGLMSVCFAVSVRSARGSVADADARRVSMARRVTAARLRYCGLHALVDDATVIVSELVTNAIQHSGGTQVTLTMTVRDNVLHLAVHDEMPGGPAACAVDSDSERGRGLFLVDAIAREHGGKWGSTDEGATIFCDLALTGAVQ